MRSDGLTHAVLPVWRNQKAVLLRAIRSIIEKRNVRSVLDIGAGDGSLAIPIADEVRDYVAVESDLTRAGKLRAAGLTVVRGVFPDCAVAGAFDLVLSSHSIPDWGDEYEAFVVNAWDHVAPAGSLAVITFVGARSEVSRLVRCYRSEALRGESPKDTELMRLLSSLGTVVRDRVVSYSWSNDLDQMVDALSWSIGGSPGEKESYRASLRVLIQREYRVHGKYLFPHEHNVLVVESAMAMWPPVGGSMSS